MDRVDKNKPTTVFMQPMFDYIPDEWLAMVYAWPEKVDSKSKFLIGIAFKTEKYAQEFFGLLRAYNDGENVDDDNNIRLSFITEGPEDYSVYIFPSSERKNVTNYAQESEKKFGSDTQLLVANLTMCKPFPYGENSNFKKFKELYSKSNPVELMAFILKDGELSPLESIEPIIKHHVKIKHRKQLTNKEEEYHHGKSIMGK